MLVLINDETELSRVVQDCVWIFWWSLTACSMSIKPSSLWSKWSFFFFCSQSLILGKIRCGWELMHIWDVANLQTKHCMLCGKQDVNYSPCQLWWSGDLNEVSSAWVPVELTPFYGNCALFDCSKHVSGKTKLHFCSTGLHAHICLFYGLSRWAGSTCVSYTNTKAVRIYWTNDSVTAFGFHLCKRWQFFLNSLSSYRMNRQSWSWEQCLLSKADKIWQLPMCNKALSHTWPQV